MNGVPLNQTQTQVRASLIENRCLDGVWTSESTSEISHAARLDGSPLKAFIKPFLAVLCAREVPALINYLRWVFWFF